MHHNISGQLLLNCTQHLQLDLRSACPCWQLSQWQKLQRQDARQAAVCLQVSLASGPHSTATTSRMHSFQQHTQGTPLVGLSALLRVLPFIMPGCALPIYALPGPLLQCKHCIVQVEPRDPTHMNELEKACRWPLASNDGTHLYLFVFLVPAGSMGRTAEDLIMLDSIVRTKNYSSSGEGMLPGTVSCDVNVNTNLSLAGLRIGLPSNFGELAAGWSV